MTMAAVIENRLAGTQTVSRVSRIARIEIIHDLGAAEPIWRDLEDPRSSTPPISASTSRPVGRRMSANAKACGRSS